MYYPRGLHPDDVWAVAMALNLEEIDTLFSEIYFYTNESIENDSYHSQDIDELAHLFSEQLELVVSNYLSITPENMQIEELKNSESNFDTLYNCFCDPDLYGLVTILDNVPDYIYYGLLALKNMHTLVYEFLNGEIDEVLALRKVVKLSNNVLVIKDEYFENEVHIRHEASMKMARSVSARKAANKKHQGSKQKRLKAIRDWRQENSKTGVSKNAFSEENASKYFVTSATLRKWLQGKESEFLKNML